MSSRPRVHGVAVELTAGCNQKCDYCYNAWRDDNGASLGAPADTATLLERLAKLLDALDIEQVTLTGGEPFARRDLFEVLDFLASRRIPVQMISNGTLVTAEAARRLAGAGVRCIQITLNGPDAALHEEHVGPGHFAATIEGISALVEQGVEVVGCVVVTRKNARQVAPILDLFRSLGVYTIALSRFSPAGYAVGQVAALLPSRDDLLAAFGQALPYARAEAPGLRMVINCTMPVPPCAVEVEEFTPIGFGVCPIGTSMQELALGPDGALRNCTLHRKGLGSGVDVLDPSVDVGALVASVDVTEYKRELPAFCQGCVHAPTCGGGCGAAAEWVLGSRAFPDPFVWQHVDDAFHSDLERARGRVEAP